MGDFDLEATFNSVINEYTKSMMNSFFDSLSSIPFTIDLPFLNNKILIYFNSFNFIIICIVLFLFLLLCFLFCFIGINRKLKDIRRLYENDLETKYKLNTGILNEINNNLREINIRQYTNTTLEDDIKFKSKKI